MYCCFETGKIIRASEALAVGSIIPGVKVSRVMENSDSAREARKKSIRAFIESEANCNTCRDLERLPHHKSAGRSVFPGKCLKSNPDRNGHPYGMDASGVMRFAPDDWQGMSCYTARHKKQPPAQ